MTKADKEGQRKTPILRFKGFTDDWEQRKLKELIKEPLSYGLNASSKEYDGIHKYLRITDIDEENRKFNDNKLTSPDIKFNALSKRYLLDNNDLVFARTGASTGKVYMYKKTDGEVYYAGFLIKASLTSDFNVNFIFQQTYQKKYYHYVKIISQRSGQPGINSKEYGNFKFSITQIQEQNKIGKLFKLLDTLLTLYERKLKLLSQVKKCFLDNLFAEKEYPNLRFKGFTGAWEQRKIKDYVSYRRGSFPQPYGKKEWYGGSDSMPFVQVVDVKENLHLADHTKQRISKLAQPKSVFVPAGEVLVTVQGSIGRVAITQYPSYIDRTLIVFKKYNTCTDKYFWAYTLQRKFEIEKRKAPGGTIKTITKKALSDFNVPITNYEEQGYLGTFFSKIDKLLTLYKDKQKHLIEIKKSLLNTMFI